MIGIFGIIFFTISSTIILIIDGGGLTAITVWILWNKDRWKLASTSEYGTVKIWNVLVFVYMIVLGISGFQFQNLCLFICFEKFFEADVYSILMTDITSASSRDCRRTEGSWHLLRGTIQICRGAGLYLW